MLRLFTTLYYLLPLLLTAQALPPVTGFTPDDYRAGSQNWDIVQDGSGRVYVANNTGLLEHDGSRWHHYPTPNESIMRSVAAIGDRIYTGSYMAFGYWERGATGRLNYHNLSDSLVESILPDEQFWDIINYRRGVLFQSLQQLYIYRPEAEKVTVVRPPTGITKTFVVEDQLYFTDVNGGLSALEGGEIRTVIRGDNSPNIVHLWSENEQLYAQSATRGTYVVEGAKLVPVARFPFLKDRRIYSATRLREGGQVFGTVADGVFITGTEGTLLYHLDRANGLTNNTVLSVYQDAGRNVWLGSDNGLNCINLASPLRKYTDRSGRIGTVYAAARFNDKFYLGSNQGLFVREGEDFRLLEGTRGQVWTLYEYDGTLFCGHDAGTFVVENDGVRQLGKQKGSWTFAPVAERPDLLLVGGYGGISVLERDPAGNWQSRNPVTGFDLSARYLSQGDGPEAYVSHEYRGVYGLRLDADYQRVIESRRYETPGKGQHSGLTRFRDSIYFLSRDGLYVLDDYQRGFERHPRLSARLPSGEYRSGKMTAIDDRLYISTAGALAYLHPAALEGGLSVGRIPIDAEVISAPLGYENVTALRQDSLLVGTADGYLLLDGALPLPVATELLLAGIEAHPGESDPLLLSREGEVEVPYANHNLVIRLAVPDFSAYFHPRFRYRLTDRQSEWSEWQDEPVLDFPELGYGDYLLDVQATLAGSEVGDTVSYRFTVLRPWYATYPALLSYLLIAAASIYLLHRSYTRYYRGKQRRWQLEQERAAAARQRQSELELTRLNNERLREDIEAKSREAALAAMNLVRKNELLQRIKRDLLAGKDEAGNVKGVVHTIDRNIDEAETWSLFRDAFENADRDFFKKIKERHPELTPNDLKVCAYLRLNLSTKEIASMLNISPRSVEVKRYRLRKKMGLERETGLTDYILAV